jgi:hypothetical protein
MIRGSGGAVLELKPFFTAGSGFLSNLAAYGEFTDFGRNRVINGKLFDAPDISAGVKLNLSKNINLGVRYDDIIENAGFQLSGGVSFEDKELASLLGLAMLAK